MMKVLVLGATGLLGNAVFRVLSEIKDISVCGTVRNKVLKEQLRPVLVGQLIAVENLVEGDELVTILDNICPDIVINCISCPRGISHEKMDLISTFSLLPRLLAHLCRLRSIRLIQISSDGVFDGKSGGYTEQDLPNARDPYGIAKILGEVDGPGVLTIRTSVIGPELNGGLALLEWFLAQENECVGYTRVIFSGFPSIVLAQIIRDVILVRPDLEGVYHVASSPISRFDLFQIIAKTYGRSLKIIPDDKIKINRSLSGDKFRLATGYKAPEWPEMIDIMYLHHFGLRKK